MTTSETKLLYTYNLENIINANPELKIVLSDSTDVNLINHLIKLYMPLKQLRDEATNKLVGLKLGKASELIRFLTNAVSCCDMEDMNNTLNQILSKLRNAVIEIEEIPTQPWRLLKSKKKRYDLYDGYIDVAIGEYSADERGTIAVINHEIWLRGHKLDIAFRKCERKLWSNSIRVGSISPLSAGFVYLEPHRKYVIFKSPEADILEETHFDTLFAYYISMRMFGDILTNSDFEVFAHVPHNVWTLKDILTALNSASNRISEVI